MNKMILVISMFLVTSILVGCGSSTYEGPTSADVGSNYKAESLSDFRSHHGLIGQSDADKFKALGWDTSDVKTDAELHAKLIEFGCVALAVNAEFITAPGDHQPDQDWVDDAYKAASGGGLGLINSFGAQLMEHGDTWHKNKWSKDNNVGHAIQMAILVQSRGRSSFGKYLTFPSDKAVQ
jgi:hypothetical protein